LLNSLNQEEIGKLMAELQIDLRPQKDFALQS